MSIQLELLVTTATDFFSSTKYKQKSGLNVHTFITQLFILPAICEKRKSRRICRPTVQKYENLLSRLAM